MASILATQPRSPLPKAGKWSVLEERHVTQRRRQKHQPPALLASPPPGDSAEQPQAHQSQAWSPDSEREAASGAQRWSCIRGSGRWCGQCRCSFRTSSFTRASHSRTGLVASRPGAPTFPETLGTTQSVHCHLFFCVGHPGSLQLSPPAQHACFPQRRTSPIFLSEKYACA